MRSLILTRPQKPDLKTCSSKECFDYYLEFKEYYKEAARRAAEIDVGVRIDMSHLISAFIGDVAGIFDRKGLEFREDNVDFIFDLMLEIFNNDPKKGGQDFDTFCDILSSNQYGQPLVLAEILEQKIAATENPQPPIQQSPPQIRKDLVMPASPHQPRKPSPLRRVEGASSLGIESPIPTPPASPIKPNSGRNSEFSLFGGSDKNNQI